MNKQKRAKIVAMRLIVIALSILIGVLFTAQWRSLPSRVTNPIAPYSSLKETREALYEEQEQLRNTIKETQRSLERTLIYE